jgi:hypothetical protein
MRPSVLTGLLGSLAERLGGVNELAAACGVSPKTIWSWEQKVMPRGSAIVALKFLCEREGLPEPVYLPEKGIVARLARPAKKKAR